MRWYSDFVGKRTKQVTADLLALGLIALWVWFGITVFRMIRGLAGFGEQMITAGQGFRTTMTDVGRTLGGVPLIGGGIRVPFDGASQAGGALESAGQSQVDAMTQLALVLSTGMAGIPILMILLVWLGPRLRFMRKSATAHKLSRAEAGVDLLALRALANQKIKALAAIDANPMAAWRREDPLVIRELAALELKSSGVRLPETGVRRAKRGERR